MKSTITSIIIAAVLIVGALALVKVSASRSGNYGAGQGASVDNVSIENGVQVVTIHARGGYQPARSLAKAGMPTVIRFDTKSTFDCSSYIRIPSMGISKMLPQTGTTDIDVGTATAGTLQGMCGMGMYPFQVEFK